MAFRHVPVMREEAIQYLNCAPGKRVVDSTLGGAGHAMAVVKKILPGGLFIGIDRDAGAVENARRQLAAYAENVRLVHDNFVNLSHILLQLEIDSVDAILADLGLSFDQIESSGRGFSFRKDEPLDMRMDTQNTETAADIVNKAGVKRLTRIFKDLGEERWAGRISKKIGEKRKTSPIETTGQLAEIIRGAIPGKEAARRRIHPATKAFMALRIEVNRELEALDSFLNDAVEHLKPGGRICVISFHSLEDRIVKHRFNEFARGCECPRDFPVCVCGKKPVLRVLTRKIRRPSQEETLENPMSRSARLRAAEKLQ
ncbi:MAG: 16S rRNA (cytosine(1402)-N(4))-methyltransferase RsmH [Desulfobacterales bacterium]|nr:16S rRNA (cytosine(1402)-N(4))-methyltransferase RsmH [Desulfobacterales bacterium]